MPEPYQRRQSGRWWLQHGVYRRYMLREATSVPLFAYCLLLIGGLYRLTQGEAAFIGWLELLRSPPIIALQVLALAAAVFHAWTWIALVPKILVIDTPRLKVSGQTIKRAHQATAVIAFTLLAGLAWYSASHAAALAG